MPRIKLYHISTIIYAGRWIDKMFGEGRGEVYSCIIFICNYDPFGRGKAVYRFRYREDEEKALYLGDGTYKIYLNTACFERFYYQYRKLMYYIAVDIVKDEHLVNQI